MEIQDADVAMEYIKGKDNCVADYLSRCQCAKFNRKPKLKAQRHVETNKPWKTLGIDYYFPVSNLSTSTMIQKLEDHIIFQFGTP